MHQGCLDSGCDAGSTAASPTEQLLDTVMLQLRLATGLDVDAVARQHGEALKQKMQEAVRQHEAQGLVLYHRGQRGELRCRLSDPEGFLLSNDIISDIFAALSPG